MYLLLVINTACTRLDCAAMLEISHIFHSGLRQSLSISESEASQESIFFTIPSYCSINIDLMRRKECVQRGSSQWDTLGI